MGGVLINQLMENRREASREKIRSKEKIRQDIYKKYIEESIMAIQKDLACGFGAVDRMEQLLLRARIMKHQQPQDLRDMLAEIRDIDFNPDPHAKSIGTARVSDFGEVFGLWVFCGYRSIELYSDIAHKAVAYMQSLLDDNAEVTEEVWEETAGHLFIGGELQVLTMDTVAAIIRDLDKLGIIAREFEYESFFDPLLMAVDEPWLEILRETVESKVADFKKKEERSPDKEFEEKEEEPLAEEDEKND